MLSIFKKNRRPVETQCIDNVRKAVLHLPEMEEAMYHRRESREDGKDKTFFKHIDCNSIRRVHLEGKSTYTAKMNG